MAFERDGETIRLSPSGPLIANTVALEIAAAAAGLGIIATFEELIRPCLTDGRLVTILDDWTQDFSGPFLYYPSWRHMPAPLRAFIDFVRSERTVTA